IAASRSMRLADSIGGSGAGVITTGGGVAAGGGGVGDDLYWAPADATSISDARTASFRIRLSFMADSLPYRYPFDRQVRVAPLVPTALEGESILEAVSLEDRDGETGGLLGV